ncbi:MAG: hypothetical protein LBI27_01315 [Clostridiales bacterium]|nr:hypothetical protein [Clostridiales bacterium]
MDLPVAEHFWRVSDVINAVCNAGLKIIQVHESYDLIPAYEQKDIERVPEMRKLPSEFTILAVK